MYRESGRRKLSNDTRETHKGLMVLENSKTGSPEEHELISIRTYNESQDALQRKIGCSTPDGALRNFSELRLVYHESGRRKLPTERQRNGQFEERLRRQMVPGRRVCKQQRDSAAKSEVQIHDSRKRITGSTYEFGIANRILLKRNI